MLDISKHGHSKEVLGSLVEVLTWSREFQNNGRTLHTHRRTHIEILRISAAIGAESRKSRLSIQSDHWLHAMFYCRFQQSQTTLKVLVCNGLVAVILCYKLGYL